MIVYEYTTSRHRVAEIPARIRSPRDTLPVIASLLRNRETEALVVIALDAKNGVIGTEVVYTGNVSASLVRVGELFRFAVRHNAVGIILAHNHPSGDPVPSPDDLHLTAEAIAAGRLLDIDVLDHLIVGDDPAMPDGIAWTSLRDRGVSFDRRPASAA